MTGRGGPGRSERAYRLLLRLLTKRFRLEAETEMVEVFRDGLRQAQGRGGVVPVVVFWLRSLADLALTAASPRKTSSTLVHGESIDYRRGGITGRRGGDTIAAIISETRYALRTLRRRVGFTTTVVLTFAMGVGATTAVFSAFRHVLLRPLPFDSPEELVQVWETRDARPDLPFSIPNMESARQRTGSFTDLGAWMFGDFPSVTLTGGDRPERIPGAMITANLLALLGVEPTLGRSFIPEENEPGNQQKVILSHEEWSIRFGADPDILGRVLQLNGTPHTVVGIMPPGFEFPVGSGARVWRPLPLFQSWRDSRRNHLLQVLGRIKPGVTVGDAQLEVAALGRSLAEEYPESNGGEGMRVVGLLEQTVGDVRPALSALMAAVLLLWLVAAANIANLGVARVLDRTREVAVRAAHGASRLQIARLVTIESLVAGTLGAGLGLVLASLGVEALSTLGPLNFPRMDTIRMDRAAVGFALGLTAFTALLAALVPELVVSGSSVMGALARGSSRVSMGRAGRHVRGGLVASEFGPGFGPSHRCGAPAPDPCTAVRSRPGLSHRQRSHGRAQPRLCQLPGP